MAFGCDRSFTFDPRTFNLGSHRLDWQDFFHFLTFDDLSVKSQNDGKLFKKSNDFLKKKFFGK